MNKPKTDLLTIGAVSAFSLILAILVHEHGGHALACAAQGGRLLELGAFYVDCEYASVSELGYRFIAFAGPLASFLAGLVGILLFDRSSRLRAQQKFFFWHFATVNWMIAAGYLIFSGMLGIGDFGFDQNGVFYQAQPEWLVRAGLTVLGLAAYIGVVLLSVRKMDSFIGGETQERIARAQTLSFTAWVAGGIAAVLIGLLNPHGIVLVLVSSLASCVGGTSGLAWMMQLMKSKTVTGESPFIVERNRAWIVGSGIFLLIYAILLGPTIFLA